MDNKVAIAMVLWLAPLLAGCQPSGSDASAETQDALGEEHPSRPDTLHAAVGQLKQIRDEVRNAIQAGQPNDAHHPLHEVGNLLEVLPEVAADTDLPREKWDVAKAETDKLFNAFGVIDKAFHVADGDKQAAYKEVADQIDRSLATLESLLPLTGEVAVEPIGSEVRENEPNEQ